MTIEQASSALDLLIRDERYADARQLLHTIRPQIPEAMYLYYMGFLAHRELKLDESIQHYQRGLALAPHEISLHYGLALAALTVGDYSRGWREFEWRLRAPGNPQRRNFPQPQWSGREDLRGKRILLHAEGGLGDAIHFCRYAPKVAALGAMVLLECHRELVPLLSRLPGVSSTYAKGDCLPEFDFHSPFQSLPAIFGTTLQTIPNDVPYLAARPERIEEWQQKLGPRAGFRVGIAWCGNPVVWPRRSRTLSIFAPLASIDGIEFHSLQAGPAAAEPPTTGMRIADHSAALKDMGETAALVSHIDLVISVDSAVAHLAGALAKQVWVLLPKDACFRYLLERTDSPWYPTMRLFRQKPNETDWTAAVDAITTTLRQRVGDSK